MVQRNILMRQKSLDTTQSKTAMKVLEKYCRKKYRHSTLVSEDFEQHLTPEPLSPFIPSSTTSQFGFNSSSQVAGSAAGYNRFSHLSSPTVERPQSLFFSETGSKTASGAHQSPRIVSELFDQPIKEEIK